jgi:hypothetical protein
MECLCFQWDRRLCHGYDPCHRQILPLASTVKAAHDIYVWERAMGSLIKILEGPKEELIDVDVILFQNAADFLSGILQNRLLSLEHNSHGRMECFCSRLCRIRRK